MNKQATGWEKIFVKCAYLTKNLSLEYTKISYHNNKTAHLGQKQGQKTKIETLKGSYTTGQ